MLPTSKGASSSRTEPDADAVLGFWFGDCTDPDNVKRRGKFWFASTPEQDRTVRTMFGELHERVQRGELDHWMSSPQGILALVLVLDQFTRNLYRGSASAFANDARALAAARSGVERGVDRLLHMVERAFLYMPFQHSENLEDQRESLRLFGELREGSPAPLGPFAENAYQYAALHYEIVERFGRFPHRNKLLGRRSTPEEIRYLEDGGHRFGQG